MSIDDAKLTYDGVFYDSANKYFDFELEFWNTQAKEAGKDILELCAGTGRLTIPLAQSGFNMTGVDFTDSMLEQGLKKTMELGLNIDWVKSDIRDFNLDKQFDMIFIPFNSMLHLQTNKDIVDTFKCVRNHLKPEGRFVIDIFNPSMEILARDPNQRFKHSRHEFFDPTKNAQVKAFESGGYDRARQIKHVQFIYIYPDGEEHLESFDLRILYPVEIDTLLEYNGFKVVEKYGYFDMSSFVSDSPKQLIVCKKCE
ncbi:MAG TPA: class I SAM-dependent methyltransferase [Caldisericia bacterium]|nr:class I SAM-dependent methyltransferase [Caldisericia bacterium]HPF48405.1 class I SAM-dependent methyltransferase [Caldisericia bacterium]HPI83415.1 class I SAM-dependent methyltransferase [Caldisericia bacterium]HPQ92859.1 class I SAM-dependent methyltransferase [Caldisericia bacterium]HRV74043.1 class I SAM-dependent methyltransferase [Caldisericia bacterium]